MRNVPNTVRSLLFTAALVTLGCSDPGVEPSPADLGELDAGVEDGSNDVRSPIAPDVSADTAAPVVEKSIFERGPFNVGHRRINFTYDGEFEVGREIKLVVWYPTRQTEGDPGIYIVSYRRHEVIADAEVAIDGQAPLLVFSHGNTSLAEQSYFMTEFWASHGWVVIAPYHTGNTIFDAGGGVNLASAPDRPQDITAAMDVIYDLPADDPLSGKISDDVVLTGHSFGGFTTLASTGSGFAVDEMIEFCSQPDPPFECSVLDQPGVEELFRGGFLDPRIDVAIPQTPGGYFVFQDGLSLIEVPTLLMTAGRDATLPPADEGNPIWATLQGRHVRLDLPNAGHFTFSNMCTLLPGVPEVTNDGCADDFIDPKHAYDIINAHALAFARYHLFGDEEYLGLFDGSDDRYGADVIIEQKAGAFD